jgi:paraquat-inducible protein B
MRFLSWSLLPIALLCACQAGELSFHIRFHDAAGLRAGDRVFLANQEVGKVESIQALADGIQVAVRIRPPLRQQVTRGSRYTIETDPTQPKRQSVRITPDPECQPLKDGAVVEGTAPKAELFGPLLGEFGESLEILHRQLQGFTQELERLPQSPQFRDLERRLQELARKMREAEEQLQQDVLPRLRHEMDRLREELEKARPREKTPPAGGKAIDL